MDIPESAQRRKLTENLQREAHPLITVDEMDGNSRYWRVHSARLICLTPQDKPSYAFTALWLVAETILILGIALLIFD